MGAKHITQEQKEEVKRLLAKGHTKPEITEITGISRNVVYRITSTGEKRTSLVDIHKEQVVKLYKTGMYMNAIAERLGISKGVVQRSLKDMPKYKVKEPKINPTSNATNPKISKTPSKNNNTDDIKNLWLQGKTMSQITRILKIGFTKVKTTIIDLGLENVQANRILKISDRHTGMVKVRLNRNTEVFMNPEKWSCENEFREFKIKQLGL